MAPTPVAAIPVASIPVAAIAVLHLVILAPFSPAIVILSAHCQTDNGKNHQKSEHDGSLQFHVSPFGTSLIV
jgi:hypothetical protein